MAGIIIAIVAIITVAWLIIAKAHAASAIFVVGTILLLIAGLMGKVSASTVEIKSSGTALYDELLIIEHIIAGRFSGIGLSIMVLFGFVAYMRHIGADARSVVMLSAPLKRFHGSYWLVPITFVLGSVLSLVVPSAAGLSLLLIATLLPALIAAGLSPLTVGAVIVTSSTIMPTPLEAGIIQGAKLTGMTPSSFVFGHVAKATVPTLILTSLVHMWWQWYMDRRDVRAGRGHDPHVAADDQADRATAEAMERASTVPAAYALLPILPLLVIIVTAILNQSGAIGFEFGIVPTTVVCSLFALICEMIRTRSVTSVFDGFKSFFTGMGDAAGGVVALVITASVLVEGIQQLGIITALTDAARSSHGAATVVSLSFVAATALLSVLTGSGTAPYFSFAEVVGHLPASSGVLPVRTLTAIWGTSNLMRQASPVCAAVLIVAGAIKVSPAELVKRTAVPMTIATICNAILAMLFIQV